MKSRPISYVKANLAKVIDEVRESSGPIMITQSGSERAVLQDSESYERMRSALAMLKLIAIGDADVGQGRPRPQREVFRDLRKRTADRANDER